MSNSVTAEKHGAAGAKPHSVCPWWIGYLMASPIRRIFNRPSKILAPHVHEGMTVLEPGPGMGFFSLELARLVGPTGRVIAVDIQSRMLDGLRRRAAKAEVLDRLDLRLASPDSLGLADLDGAVDFTLAYAMVHELPGAARFFREVARASKTGERGCSWSNPRGTSRTHCLTPNFRPPATRDSGLPNRRLHTLATRRCSKKDGLEPETRRTTCLSDLVVSATRVVSATKVDVAFPI